MANEAKLNLVIQAQDDAKGVLEEFANNVKSVFEDIKTQMSELFAGEDFKMPSPIDPEMMTNIAEDINVIKEALSGMGEAAATSGEELNGSLETVVTQLDSIEIAIKEMGSGLTEGLTQASEAMQSLGKDAEETGTKLHSALGFGEAQIAGTILQDYGQQINDFMSGAIDKAAEFDQNVQNTAASIDSHLTPATRLSADQIENMKNKAIDMGNAGFFSANQIADAMNTLAKQGVNYSTIMGGMIQEVHDVAAANQEDLTSTANVLTDIMNSMGESLKKQFGEDQQAQIEGIGNALTTTLHGARISMDDYLSSMKYVGPLMDTMGVSIGDLSAGIEVLGKDSIRGTMAGNGLQRMLTNLNPASQAASDMMSKLGMITKDGSNIFFDASGNMKSFADVQQILHDKIGALNPQMQEMAIKAIFGQYAIKQVADLAKESPADFQAMSASMYNTAETSDILKEKQQGLGIILNGLKNHFDTFTKVIGDNFKPIIVELVPVLHRMMTSFEALSPSVQKIIVFTTAIIGILLTVGGGILAFVGTLGMLWDGFQVGIALLGVISGPFLIIVGVLAAVALAAVLLHKAWESNFGGIQQKTAIAWNFIKTNISEALKFVMQYVREGISAVLEWWHKMSPEFEQALHNIWRAIVWLQPLWKFLWGFIKDQVKDTFLMVVDIIKNAWAILSGLFQLVADILTGHWKQAWDDLLQILKGAVILVWDVFNLLFFKRITGLLGDLLKHFSIFSDAGKAIWKAISDAIGDIWSAFEKFIGEHTDSLLANVLGLFKHGTDMVINLFKAFADLLHGDVKGFWTKLEGAFGDGINIVKDLFNGLVNSLDTISSGLISGALDWGRNMMKMFVKGIEDGVADVESAVSGISDKIKSFLGFHSPTKEGATSESDVWMPNMMNMFAEGIDRNAPKVQQAIGNVTLGLQAAFQGTHQLVHNVVNTPVLNHNVPTQQNQNNQGNTININIDGRSYKTDNDLANAIAQKFRSQMTVVSA